ncbi:hypothetical protein GCM10009558_069350 [Virgisporangium aurantiacum]
MDQRSKAKVARGRADLPHEHDEHEEPRDGTDMNISAGTSSATAARQGQPPARREDPVKAVADAQEVSRDDLFATIKS